MLIAFAGLPGTGKTTVASALAARLNAVLLNKDRLRAALFDPADVEYSRRQDDFVMGVLYQLAEYHLNTHPARPVILDGRTYSRTDQIDTLKGCAERAETALKIIECTCSELTARTRLAHDATHKTHVATNRNPDLYLRVKSQWQPINEPRLIITTDLHDLETLLERITRYLNEPGP